MKVVEIATWASNTNAERFVDVFKESARIDEIVRLLS